MPVIDKIKAPIDREFAQFTELFNSTFVEDALLLQKILKHVSAKKGKQIRALFTLLCAKVCGEINRNVLLVAAGYELLHTATLVHDDVVDESMQRRGQASVNALFDNQAAVLAGDFIMSKSIGLIAQTKSARIVSRLAALAETLAAGELLQLQHSYHFIDEKDYFDIISKKTAILFVTCAESAAIAVRAPREARKHICRFAELLGLCFQIKDDIFDYTPKAEIGKPTLNDIREGKITLPLQYALTQISDDERDDILKNIRNGNIGTEFLDKIVLLVQKKGGITYAETRMKSIYNEALALLNSFAASPEREALKEMLSYVINRDI